MSDVEPPRIEFPCEYPVKVMGANVDGFTEIVLDIAQRHAPELTEAHITVRASSGDRWLAVTLTLRATGPDQLRALFEDLKDCEHVRLVL